MFSSEEEKEERRKKWVAGGLPGEVIFVFTCAWYSLILYYFLFGISRYQNLFVPDICRPSESKKNIGFDLLHTTDIHWKSAVPFSLICLSPVLRSKLKQLLFVDVENSFFGSTRPVPTDLRYMWTGALFWILHTLVDAVSSNLSNISLLEILFLYLPISISSAFSVMLLKTRILRIVS